MIGRADCYRVVRVADPEGREFAVVDAAEGGAEVGRLFSREAAELAARLGSAVDGTRPRRGRCGEAYHKRPPTESASAS